MKTRQGFVSNSSSSSFVIQKKDITPIQIELIKQHISVARRINEAVGANEDNSYDFGMRRKGGYRVVRKTQEEIDEERNSKEPCTHPEVVECSECNREIDPEKEVWDDNLITGAYYVGDYDEWSITETEDKIEGYTSMDNFDMEVYLKEIGVPESVVRIHGE